MGEPSGSMMLMSFLPLLFSVALFVTLIVLAAAIGKRAPYLRKYLWGAFGLYLLSGVLPFVISMLFSPSFSGGPDSMPSDAEMQQLMNIGGIASAVGILCVAAALVLYFLAAVGAARAVAASRVPAA